MFFKQKGGGRDWYFVWTDSWANNYLMRTWLILVVGLRCHCKAWAHCGCGVDIDLHADLNHKIWIDSGYGFIDHFGASMYHTWNSLYECLSEATVYQLQYKWIESAARKYCLYVNFALLILGLGSLIMDFIFAIVNPDFCLKLLHFDGLMAIKYLQLQPSI